MTFCQFKLPFSNYIFYRLIKTKTLISSLLRKLFYFYVRLLFDTNNKLYVDVPVIVRMLHNFEAGHWADCVELLDSVLIEERVDGAVDR